MARFNCSVCKLFVLTCIVTLSVKIDVLNTKKIQVMSLSFYYAMLCFPIRSHERLPSLACNLSTRSQ